ncbi:MAG: S-methyl-5-thioribose-1-phosphate isomerase [Spirochaetes bacterium]|uniref:Methylthioribose-1-phosphate isomerase n=1 Tax=Candidatus Ornithospirochaeta stercoripullorum TaxID=2840899 RepID=A0A9D9H5A9_9SPIO|nr:S-methyl-5-thioribose-1-phosphate isomerase [Candidatus Ornithospirochaeta stercoripullorum]
MNALSLETAILSNDRNKLIILDQTLLPNEVKYLELSTPESIWEAIYKLRVRGAPAIGVAAAYGIYVITKQLQTESMEEFAAYFRKEKEYLDSSRPTAVNLSWALNRMEKVLDENLSRLSVPQMKDRLGEEADAIREEDIAISRNIGKYGFGLLHHGDGILTHCNAGTLATAKYGTALAPIYVALENGWKDLRVYCDETRPLLQGARLSAFEMQTAGVDTTLICDNMASITMKRGLINIVFVGADRVAANGDFANKIGTSGVAILARYYGIPFYVAAPTSTIDMSLASGDLIPIEERKPEEVTEMWYAHRMAPEGVKVCNPAFDVTDHSLVTGIITDKGIAYPPFDKAFEAMGIGK